MRAELSKIRADQALVSLGMAGTRTLAARMIAAGQVYVQWNESCEPLLVRKASLLLPPLARLTVEDGPSNRYVSRGGLKLEAALDYFEFGVEGLRILDIGISTGGFTDCVLQRGATEVVGLDVGHDQLAIKLRNDPRVQSIEGVNARNLSSYVWLGKFGLIVIDVSFISLTKILPEVVRFLEDNGKILALVKPQFELGAGALNKKGILRNKSGIEDLKMKMTRVFEEQRLEMIGQLDCPVKGTDGNQEFFIFSNYTRPTDGL